MYVCVRVSRIDETVMLLNADMLPKLNYVSTAWNEQSASDVRSPADMTSVVSAVNAAAVKYLSDRQLVQQAVAAANRASRQPSSTRRYTTSSDASIYGVRSAELSLASKKYFEKHHLATSRAQPQSPEPGQRTASRIEDLLNSITSQVNGLQTTVSSHCERSPPSRWKTRTTDDASQFNSGASTASRRRSDGVSARAENSSQGLPVRRQDRRHADSSSTAASDDTWTSEWMRYPMQHR